MEIPESIQVGGRTYRIERDYLFAGDDLYGLCVDKELKIYLSKDMLPDQEAETFIHETLHAVANVFINGKITEDDVDALAAGLYQALKSGGCLK